ncbi:MOSC N-terminal beta barrel domain-containing protein [Actinoplanes sp. NPDC020271]|uniref:MOSC N-terminal beta barrel domain-containing protein n=1 Tax=Actinoplanes sp. NPDC020271 TaxID=3363896 RepID=UPI0037877E7E
MDSVAGIRRYPVKSVCGERLDQAVAEPGGLAGDRAWACVDDDGMIGSARHPRRWGGLLGVSASGARGGTGPGCGRIC